MELDPTTYFSQLAGPENKAAIIIGPTGGHKGVIGKITAKAIRDCDESAAHADMGNIFRKTAEQTLIAHQNDLESGRIVEEQLLKNLPPAEISEHLSRIDLKISKEGDTIYLFDGKIIDIRSLRQLHVGAAAGHLGHNDDAQNLITALVVESLSKEGISIGILDGRTKTLRWLFDHYGNTRKIIPFFIDRPVSVSRVVSAFESVYSDKPVDEIPIEAQAIFPEIDEHLAIRMKRDSTNAMWDPLAISVNRNDGLVGKPFGDALSEITAESELIGSTIADLLLYLHRGNPFDKYQRVRRELHPDSGELRYTLDFRR